MGIPQHYSRDVPERCERLLELLLPVVEREQFEERYGGPLKTTFLLALATPMVLLPVERLFKRINHNEGGIADDRALSGALDDAVASVLGYTLKDAPFGGNEWSYVPGVEPFNIAGSWPTQLLDRLGEKPAFEAAQQASAWGILQDLRNALAHGGVAYLDAAGRNSTSGAEMLVFAGLQTRHKAPPQLNLLRIQKDEFRDFLSRWTRWLTESGVSRALGKEPIAA